VITTLATPALQPLDSPCKLLEKEENWIVNIKMKEIAENMIVFFIAFILISYYKKYQWK
jgi:hypothetical protein